MSQFTRKSAPQLPKIGGRGGFPKEESVFVIKPHALGLIITAVKMGVDLDICENKIKNQKKSAFSLFKIMFDQDYQHNF